MHAKWMLIGGIAAALSGCYVTTAGRFSFDDSDGGTSQVPDAGGLGDAGRQGDAGPMDAGPMDAGPMDAGPMDASLDASIADAYAPDVPVFPDLTITCGTPPEITMAGDVVRVPWTVGNLGDTPAGPLTVAVLMERPAMSDAESDDLVEVGTVRIPTRVTADGSASGEVAFTAPAWVLGGENPIRCVVDSAEEVVETDESNNTADAFLTATGRPDLAATSITVLETRNLSSASPTTVLLYVVRNNGATGARDVPVLLRVAYMDGSGGANCGSRMITLPFLGPGDPASEMLDVTWNRDACYGYTPNRVFLDVDLASTIAESNETNNRREETYTPG